MAKKKTAQDELTRLKREREGNAKRSLPDTPPLPIIPQIVVRREWPYFNEDEDTEAIGSVVSSLVTRWSLTRELEDDISDEKFFGETSEYRIEGRGEPIHRFKACDGTAAVANYCHLKTCWRDLLAKACWKGVKCHPPVKVLAALVDESLGSPEWDAFNLLRFQRSDIRAVKVIEEHRREAVAIIAPTIWLFLASLTAATLRTPPKERDDTPTAFHLDTARKVFDELRSNNPKQTAFNPACRKKGFKGSSELLNNARNAIIAERKK